MIVVGDEAQSPPTRFVPSDHHLLCMAVHQLCQTGYVSRLPTYCATLGMPLNRFLSWFLLEETMAPASVSWLLLHHNPIPKMYYNHLLFRLS